MIKEHGDILVVRGDAVETVALVLVVFDDEALALGNGVSLHSAQQLCCLAAEHRSEDYLNVAAGVELDIHGVKVVLCEQPL